MPRDGERRIPTRVIEPNACVSDRRQRETDSRTEPGVEAASCSLDAMVRLNLVGLLVSCPVSVTAPGSCRISCAGESHHLMSLRIIPLVRAAIGPAMPMDSAMLAVASHMIHPIPDPAPALKRTASASERRDDLPCVGSSMLIVTSMCLRRRTTQLTDRRPCEASELAADVRGGGSVQLMVRHT